MTRFIILLGFTLMFAIIRQEGKLNMFINTKYTYLSTIAITVLSLLCIIEFIRLQQLDKAKAKQEEQDQLAKEAQLGQDRHDHEQHDHHQHNHDHAHSHHDHDHDHDHHHNHDEHDHDHFGHSHEPKSRWKRHLGYLILFFPIFTGIFLPVQTLDSSFVKAKGFSFPTEVGMDDQTPGQHQFLKPDSSVFYSESSYDKLKNKELGDFADLNNITLDDNNFMKGLEVIYNYPGDFMGKSLTFNGFAYKGEQIDDEHYFIFRFGFIHCAADSGVFGMLVKFPKGTVLNNDDWVHVTGKLTSELYQPFKQTIPVLEVTSFDAIDAPDDPYVYRIY
ncbi:TIGR03943 family protein [Paenibacillus sp. HB172176]|uniref:TIGR03943 family putative permease subunit n=1 Tax=Paenibacillus sp. HB172176 TaxID=2493690 RepID=UPI00143B62AE|nr:TIGR03943 family protein [Paenibacillus sp. HB172176]